MHEYLIGICICFSYVSTFPSNLLDSITEGGGSPLPIWRRPKAASIKFDGNVANVRKTYANTYQIFVHLDISWILLYFPYVFPGAIYLARYSTPKFSEWARLVPKVLVNCMASFLCYLEPPNCHIMQNPKKYRKLLIL